MNNILFKRTKKNTESAQKKQSRTGKDKSLVHIACFLGKLTSKRPLIKDGKKYINLMTSGDKIFLEEIGTYKYVEYKNNMFLDCQNQLVNIISYKDD